MFRLILLSIDDLLFLGLKFVDDLAVQVQLGDGHANRVLLEAHLLQVCKHHAALNLVHCLSFDLLEPFVGLFNVIQEANILRVELDCVEEINLGLLELSKIVGCSAAASNAFHVTRVNQNSAICIIISLGMRFKLQVGLGTV